MGIPMAQELKQKEHLLHSYQKKASDTSYETKIYSELTKFYATYIKGVANFKVKSKMLNMRMAEVSQQAKKLSV